MTIREVQTTADMGAVFQVIRELRPHLSFEEFLALCAEAKKRDGYRLAAIFAESRCVAAMGYRTLIDLVHGKHLYVDDLVVTEAEQSKGLGAKLLKFAEGVAVEQKCKLLRLSTGVDNVGGKKFYEREGWTLRSVTYKKPVAG